MYEALRYVTQQRTIYGFDLSLTKKILADLGKELQYLNVSVSNWPIQPGSQIVSLNVTLQPSETESLLGCMKSPASKLVSI